MSRPCCHELQTPRSHKIEAKYDIQSTSSHAVDPLPSRQKCRFYDITGEDCPDGAEDAPPQESTTADF